MGNPPRASGSIAGDAAFSSTATVLGLCRGHDRLGALRLRASRLLALLQVPPAARTAVLLRRLLYLMTVDGVPNVRVCTEPVRAGCRARTVSASARTGSRSSTSSGSVHACRLLLPHDPAAPLWPNTVRVLRNLAGLKARQAEPTRSSTSTTPASTDGSTCSSSAAAPRGWGLFEGEGQVLLVDEQEGHEAGYEVLAPARALAIYEGGLVPVDAGSVLYRVRAKRIVVATGALEQPLVFPGNDLVGVMLPGRFLATREVVARARDTRGRRGDRQRRARRDRAADPCRRRDRRRRGAARRLAASGRRGRLVSVRIDGRVIDCDLLVMSGGRQLRLLAARPGENARRGRRQGSSSPPRCRPGSRSSARLVVSSTRCRGLRASTVAARGCFVSAKMATVKDAGGAVAEGFDSIELAKR